MSVAFKRVLVIAVALGVAWYAVRDPAATPATAAPDRPAFNRGASGSLMRVSGRVDRVLADDNDGSRHQRFIIRTGAGVTLLIAHNIDLAPRLSGLAAGDTVEVYGEYEWNDKGGLMHWTHKDPGGKHAAGYIEWRGRRYQ